MKYLIIGGNAAGMSAALRLHKNIPDATITVLEKGDLVSFGACGLPYFLGDEFQDPQQMIVRPLDFFQDKNIDVLLNHLALSIDIKNNSVQAYNIITKDNLILYYDKVLISTGAQPFLPAVPGVTLKNIHTLTTMRDGIVIKELLNEVQDVVIVGGGFIGLEVAEAMLIQGKKVTLIEREERVSSRVFDSEMTQHLQNSLVKHKVNLRLSETVHSFSGSEKVELVCTDQGTYKADLVIIATGVVPETKWCADVGLDMLDNGAIIIDDQGQTSIKNVYAGGDCASVIHAVEGKESYIPLATNANKLGRILGDVMAEKEHHFQGTLGSAAIRFMDFQIARTGYSEWETKTANIDYAINVIKDFNHTSYVPKQSALSIKLIYDKKSRVLLGAQICGMQDAVLRINALAVAVFKKMTVDEIGMMDFVYSPPFSRTWDILNIAGNTCN